MLQTPFVMNKSLMGKVAQLADFDEQVAISTLQRVAALTYSTRQPPPLPSYPPRPPLPSHPEPYPETALFASNSPCPTDPLRPSAVVQGHRRW